MSDKFHSIRLHGPWQATVLEVFENSVDLDQVDSERRLKIPVSWGNWLGESFLGRVLFTRPFRMPTGLEPGQAVFLVVENGDQANVELNNEQLGKLEVPSDGQLDGKLWFRVEVGKLLKDQNHLKIEVQKRALSSPQSQIAGGLTGSVRLEIAE